jgi:hypothetical protein
MDSEIVEHYVIIEAITYIEHTTNTVVEDLNYNLRQQEEEHIFSLSYKKIKKIKESEENKTTFAKCWLLAARYVHSFSKHIMF